MPNRRAQITMSEDEVQHFLGASRRWLQVATVGKDGWPQLSTMGFVLVDAMVHFTGYRISQKMVNLRRDPRITVLVEEGEQYDRLRGVVIRGMAEFIDDPVLTGRVLVMNRNKYFGTGGVDEAPPHQKRVIVRVRARDVYSWDHVKLGDVHERLGGQTVPGGGA